MLKTSNRGPTAVQTPGAAGARRQSEGDVSNTDAARRRQSGSQSQPTTPTAPSREPDVGQETKVQQKDSDMQLQWMEGMNKHMDVPDGYAQVAVLIIKWSPELDDTHCQDEVNRLDGVFKEYFRYETQTTQLTKDNPQHHLNGALSNFARKYDGPNNLLIIYYTGHSAFRDSGTLEFYPSRGKNSENIKAKWNRAEDTLFHDTNADTLAILDTCYASNIMKSIDDDTRSYQLLAASAYDRVTAGPGDKSFTTALIQALKLCAEECQERPFSLWKLHDTINHQTHRRSNPCYIHDRLKQHNRHIYLAPLKKDEEQRKKTKEELELRTSDADLVLRFALGTRSLTAKQIDALTRHLSKACKEAEKEAKVNTHRIDWVHYEERRPNFRGTANALVAARKLKLIAARRQTISSAPDLDIPDSLAETMEGDSPAPLSSSNRPIPTSANAENVHIDRSDKTTINTTGDARINAQLSLADGPQALPDKEIREICAVQTPPTQITGVQIVGIVAGSWVLSSLTTYLLVRTLLERK